MERRVQYSTLSNIMRLLIVTPLYPPDIAPLAVYVKELAKRLTGHAEVTIIAYAHIPEKIEGVRIIAIPKNVLLPFRLIALTKALWSEIRKADVLYVQNGASTELPAGIVSFFTRTPLIIGIQDHVALASAKKRAVLKVILHFVLSRAHHIIHATNVTLPFSYLQKTRLIDEPCARPEILPFGAYPKEAFTLYEESWEKHIQALTEIFEHAKR